jgi:hypothetical protein
MVAIGLFEVRRSVQLSYEGEDKFLLVPMASVEWLYRIYGGILNVMT